MNKYSVLSQIGSVKISSPKQPIPHKIKGLLDRFLLETCVACESKLVAEAPSADARIVASNWLNCECTWWSQQAASNLNAVFGVCG